MLQAKRILYDSVYSIFNILKPIHIKIFGKWKSNSGRKKDLAHERNRKESNLKAFS